MAVGVDRIQRNFEPLQRQLDTWRQTQITDDRDKLILYEAFVEGELEAAQVPFRSEPNESNVHCFSNGSENFDQMTG